MRTDFFECLPRPTAVFLLSGILELTSAHALLKVPRQTPAPTITRPYRTLNVVSWPLQPTPPPGDPFALRRRQENTVCGYIGGDSALPATCGAGSHCVLDAEHNVVGCCPDGAPSCTAGVFTGCVDANSGPQTEVNPYVYSCTGANVCYKNVFDGGFSQFGCGTASDLAATVMNSASGITTVLIRPTVSVSYTQSISTLSEPTTLGTITSKSSSSESSTSSVSSSSSSASTVVANSAATSSSAASASAGSGSRTGAIVGGTIGGLAVLISLVALALFFLRRRNANVRQGPGPGGVRGKRISPPIGGGGTGFSALAQDNDAFETGPGPDGSAYNQPPEMTTTTSPGGAAPASPPAAALANRSMLPPIATGPPMPFQMEVSPVNDDPLDPDNDRSPFAYAGAVSAGAASVSSYPPSSSGGITTASGAISDAAGGGLYYPGQYPAAYAGGSGLMMGMNPLLVPANSQRQLESDQVPLTREIDDFSQGFHAALGRIGEEDEEEAGQEEPYRDHVTPAGAAGQGQQSGQQQQQQQEGAAGAQGGDYGSGTHDSAGSATSALSKPLWQQNRRQSRNLMWM
ncbi:hypothetical protein C8A03DRAFT_16113 [Achaetomium macrosporum]|uniref:Mid2 domain-containing protein n=1 Tax=Achaetomium macrosporum TaxID=79813 RepID=A0AAN7H6H2_9PEZI|nr:hypothetical protein C8A03DRAFT_16113 [Achaetomium macrosporum]